MKVIFLLKTYNAYGGQASFNALAQYLNKGLAKLHGPIDTLELHLYFEHSAFCDAGALDLYQGHQASLSQAGKVQWQADSRCLALHYISRVCDGDQLNQAWRQKELDFTWLLAAAKELEAVWQQQKSQLHLKLLEQLDETQNQLQCSLATLRRFGGLLTPPSTLPFNQQRRFLLQRLEQQQGHFLWSFADEFAPNGNDVGADSLHFFRDWLESQRHTSMAVFVDELLSQYGIDSDNTDLDKHQRDVYLQCVVGLAFACYKTTDFCEQNLRDKACAALSERLHETQQSEAKQKYGICLATLAAMPTSLLV